LRHYTKVADTTEEDYSAAPTQNYSPPTPEPAASPSAVPPPQLPASWAAAIQRVTPGTATSASTSAREGGGGSGFRAAEDAIGGETTTQPAAAGAVVVGAEADNGGTKDRGGKLAGPALAGVVIGALAGVVVMVIGGVFVSGRMRDRKNRATVVRQINMTPM